MIEKDDLYRLRSEHILSEMTSSISQYTSLISAVLERGSINSGPEEQLFLMLGRCHLVREAINLDEDEFFFEINKSLDECDLDKTILSCGEVPGSDSCLECVHVCPFKDDDELDEIHAPG